MKRQIGADLTGATIHTPTASSVKVHVSMNPRRRRATESYFHRRKAVAPLKGELLLIRQPHLALISIAERRWPH